MRFALAVSLPVVFLALASAGPAELAARVAALCVLGICARVELSTAPGRVWAVGLRDRVADRVRLLDPDAPGHGARPRAPASGSPAA